MKLAPMTIFGWLLLVCLSSAQGAGVKVQTKHYDVVAPSKSIAQARARQLEWSAWVFTDLFATAPHRGSVILSDRPDGAGMIKPKFGVGGAVVRTRVGGPGEDWALQWFVKPPDPRQAPGGKKNSFDALTHEAAHLQLIYLTNIHATEAMKAKFNGYGDFVPDWLDEAIAVYHEPEQMKTQRRKRLRTQMISLREFFVMSHPLFAADKDAASVKGRDGVALDHQHTLQGLDDAVDGQVEAEDIARGRVDRAKVKKIDQFYTQALAVMEYMLANGGKPFVRYVTREQAKGASMDDVLRNWQVRQREAHSLQTRTRRTVTNPKASKTPKPRKTALKDPHDFAGLLVRIDEKVGKMPATIDAFEADFLKWVRRHYPNHKSGLPPVPAVMGEHSEGPDPSAAPRTQPHLPRAFPATVVQYRR